MQELLIVAGAHLLAVASPGPDLAVVLKNSLSSGKRAGIYTSIGISMGIMVHVMYSIVGLAVIISRSVLIFNFIKMIGALYLIWIGLKALRSKKSTEEELSDIKLYTTLSKKGALKQGFLTNVLNPKATLFFLSLFTQVINVNTSAQIKAVYGLEMVLATFLWFSVVTMFMTRKPVRLAYRKVRHHIDRVFGVVLVGLGLKVALSSK
jgi:RhtB (resistance to homoserine/threonine) family protein